MTLDQRARMHAATLRAELNQIALPEPRGVVRRARRRRQIATASVVVLVATALTSFVVVAEREGSTNHVEVGGPHAAGYPAGTAVNDSWAMVLKQSAGIGADASPTAITSDGERVLLAGAKSAGSGTRAAIWRSNDGLRWTEAEPPTQRSGLSAIASHEGTVLAIGTPESPPDDSSAFVWRSNDGGSHWKEIADGPVFGDPVRNSRPVAFVSGLVWHDGWWIAFGGAADGYEGIWISRDGAAWKLVLDSRTAGSIAGIVETPQGALMAYGAFAVGWFTNDPTKWGKAVPIVTPSRSYLSSVAPGAAVAVGANIDQPGVTSVLRSLDGGRSWVEDAEFRSAFPDAWAIGATAIGGRDVIVGTTTPVDEPGPSKAWLFSEAGGWTTLPAAFDSPTIPSSAIPQVPPGRSLSLVSSVDGRVVMFGTDRRLDRYYTYATGQAVAPRPRPETTTTSVPANPPALTLPVLDGWQAVNGVLSISPVVNPDHPYAEAAVATFAFDAEPSRNCDVPVAALEALGPSDAFVYVHTPLGGSFGAEPPSSAFVPTAPPENAYTKCLTRPADFRQAVVRVVRDGVLLEVFTALGNDANPETQDQLERVVAGLIVDRT